MPKFTFLSSLNPFPRLLISLGIGSIVLLLFPAHYRLPVRGIVAWDLGVISFLTLTLAMMQRTTPGRMWRSAQTNNESRIALLMVVVSSACVSMLAIVYMLKDAKGLSPNLLAQHVGLAVLTVICSWLLVHTIFALHYAHEYYIFAVNHPDAPRGLQFPQEDAPDYWDFLYFSFVIGMTSQVSDVEIASRNLRRISLVHSILSFFFNTAIVAMNINLIAGLI
jgi:uncharacterized membrane protein